MSAHDYASVLKAVKGLPFPVGRRLLIDILRGDESNDSVRKNRLDRLDCFGSMAYQEDELSALIDRMFTNGLLRYSSVNGNKYVRVIEISEKGEALNPRLKKASPVFSPSQVTDDDRRIFSAVGPFLDSLNDEQKKAVVSPAGRIVCIAGAGSGKTAVLARRVQFLAAYRSVPPSSILAITFTRKARQEMVSRIGGIPGVRVETFNSFCEKVLNDNHAAIYGRKVRMIGYSDRIRLFRHALGSLQMPVDRAVDCYFTDSQRKDKALEQLASMLLADCFAVRDYFRSRSSPIAEFYKEAEPAHRNAARLVYDVCVRIGSYMEAEGLRDYSDQLVDAIRFYKGNPQAIPRFAHVLVDEFQDVNAAQVGLLDLLAPDNLFCVGDPRQSIFGWRGSDIGFILGFPAKYPGSEVIFLRRNYRSSRPIVQLINESIRVLGMPDLESEGPHDKNIRLVCFDSEEEESDFIAQRIMASSVERGDIFVIARTNRQLSEISRLFAQRGIPHIVKTDEHDFVNHRDQVMLATIHAIKGMEAKMVFVAGCTPGNFPCRGSERPVVDFVAYYDYDKDEEERRLFYVALSRAKEALYVTYSTKSPTSFISDGMLKLFDVYARPQPYRLSGSSSQLLLRLKEWRRDQCAEFGMAAFMVLHDRTLQEIAERRPSSERELQSIPGIGPQKMLKYGEDILRIVNGA